MPAQFRMYIVRHGETEWNRMRKIQGQLDIPLNETGLKQAMLVAEALRDIPFVRAFSSDLQRASKVRILTTRPPSLIELFSRPQSVSFKTTQRLFSNRTN